MKRRSVPFSRARGATLIEVLAGLVLLGTILSSALVARGRFDRQWRDADAKLAAVRHADELIGRWLSQPPGAAPVPGEGQLGPDGKFTWHTTWVRDPAARRLGARVARLQLFDADAQRRLRSRARPLVSIEFLLRPRPQPAPSQPSTQRSSP